MNKLKLNHLALIYAIFVCNYAKSDTPNAWIQRKDNAWVEIENISDDITSAIGKEGSEAIEAAENVTDATISKTGEGVDPI